jgi:hypothetical protein
MDQCLEELVIAKNSGIAFSNFDNFSFSFFNKISVEITEKYLILFLINSCDIHLDFKSFKILYVVILFSQDLLAIELTGAFHNSRQAI